MSSDDLFPESYPNLKYYVYGWKARRANKDVLFPELGMAVRRVYYFDHK